MLTAFLGVMNSGKSALALQYHFSLGGQGLLFTAMGRDGEGVISSRVGLSHPAIEVTESVSIWAEYARKYAHGGCPYVIADEAQFLDTVRVGQLAQIADLGVDVYCFGLRTNFLGELFVGSKRLIELADRVEELPVRVNCWCGQRANFNAKVVDGMVARSGETVDVGDVGSKYQVLCRRHFLEGELG